jgi:hypothetical protein
MSNAINNPAIRTMAWLAPRGLTAAAAVMVILALSTIAHANFKQLSQRLPASSNAVIAVNVAKLLETPYAKSEQWTERSADAWAKQPLMIPPGAKRVLMAADVKTSSMDSNWEMSLLEMDKLPTIQELAKAEGGHIDRVWDKDAVASPINAYFVPLDGTTLASITPAERAAIAKWVRTPVKPEGNVTSDYIKGVLATLGDTTDIVMALDLEGAFGVPNIRRWLDENEIKEIDPKQLDEVARLLGTMKGITLTITVKDDVNGKAVVELDRDAALLKPSAKSIMLGVMNTAGLRIDDIKQWTFDTSGKQITMAGKLSTPALRKLLSIVQSPIPAATVATKQSAGSGEGSMPSSPAEASQRYYKVIAANLDNFRPGTSLAETATWGRATTKRIDQLPILNVDPALVEWGTMVSTRLKQAIASGAVGQTQVNARVAGIADPGYTSYTYDNEGNYQTDINRVEQENAKRQRRQASLEQKAQAQEQAMRIINEIAESRPKIRAAMVEKYQVEF